MLVKIKEKSMNVSGHTITILSVSHKDEDVTRDDTWDEESKINKISMVICDLAY